MVWLVYQHELLYVSYLVVDGGEPILTPLYWRIRSGAWNLISLGLRYQMERPALGLCTQSRVSITVFRVPIIPDYFHRIPKVLTQ